MNFLVDVNLSPIWVDYLVAQGFRATHWSTLGDRQTPDAHIMQYAMKHDMIVITQDMDFGMHLALGRMDKPSVVLLRVRYAGPEVVGTLIVKTILASHGELSTGALITVDDESSRLKLLPM